MDPNLVDLLERARAGDTVAFGDLVGLWGDQTYRLAWLLTGDRRPAEQAVRAAWLGTWRALPSFHTHRAFRPWLMETVIEAARERDSGVLPPPMTPLAGADPEVRIAAALRYGVGFRFGEVTLAQATDLRATRKRLEEAGDLLDGDDERAVTQRFADAMRGVELIDTFFEDALARRLERDPVAEAVREIGATPDAIWTASCSIDGLRALTGSDLHGRPRPGHVGTRAAGRGRLADRWRATDEVTITLAEAPHRAAWTSRVKPIGATTPIELRSTLTLEPVAAGTRATVRLDGIAIVPNAFHRLLPRSLRALPDLMGPAVHRSLERMASVAAARPRTSPL